MEPSSAEFEQQFFAGAETVTLEIEVLKETHNDILAAIERNNWLPGEGPRILLTLGLGYAQGQRLLQANDEERARLADRLLNLESVTAVMKFRTFQFMRDNQILEMRMGALRNAKTGLEGVVHRPRSEKAALENEMESLRAELETLQERLGTLETEQPEAEPEPLWNGKLIDRIKNICKGDKRNANKHQQNSGA